MSSRHLSDASSRSPEHKLMLGKLPKLTIQNSFGDAFSIFEDWRDVVSEYTEK